MLKISFSDSSQCELPLRELFNHRNLASNDTPGTFKTVVTVTHKIDDHTHDNNNMAELSRSATLCEEQVQPNHPSGHSGLRYQRYERGLS